MPKEISVPELMRQVGLEELADIGSEEIIMDFMPAAVTGLADGDIMSIHQIYDGQRAVLYGESHYGEGTSNIACSGQLYIGREDGIAEATNEIILAQRAHDAPAEIADIILALGAHHTTPEDLRQGMENAHTLLKDAGMVIIRGFAQPGTNELGTKEIAGWAFEAGFQEKGAIRLEASLDSVGGLLLTGHFGEREIETIVLTK